MRKYESAKYLRVTMYDNDFTNSLLRLADILYDNFKETRFPEEDELSLLEQYIKHLWYSLHNIDCIMMWNKNGVGFKETHLECFEPHLEFVDYLDIPEDWYMDADVYIPMFDDAEILRR